MAIRQHSSHGDGKFKLSDFREIGSNVIFESGVLVFHPENIVLGSNIYIGHNTILKGYYKGILQIKSNTWIGQGCFFHSAGEITIGESVGIGPMVKILTSSHQDQDSDPPIIDQPIEFLPVTIEDNADIGIGSILLPGVTIGKNSIIGAGSVVTRNIPENAIAYGNPAKTIRVRDKS